jgi:hypothetical protein
LSLKETGTQTTREAPSAPIRAVFIRAVFIAPTLLPVCCVCGLIRDEKGSRPHHERWVAQRMYRKTHGVNPTKLALTHTYCPICFTKVQGTVRRYFREIGLAPSPGSPALRISTPLLQL